jgi:hypothetical protein
MEKADFTISVNPQVATIHSSTNSIVTIPVTITNMSLKSTDLHLVLKKIKSVEPVTGQVIYENNKQFLTTDTDVSSYVSVKSNGKPLQNVILSPQQKSTINVEVMLDQQRKSDYMFSLFYISNNNNYNTEHTHSVVIPGVASHILITTAETSPKDLELKEFSVPFFLMHGPVPVTTKLLNNGDHLVKPVIEIEISNMFNQVVETKTINETPILAHSSRSIYPVKIDVKNHSISNNDMFNYNDIFLLGKYTASITVKYQNTHVAEKKITFIVFPFDYVLVFFIGAYFFFSFIERVKSKL